MPENYSSVELLQHFFPTLSAAQMQQYQDLGQLYTSWNEKINLISRKDIDQLYLHHILHSLSIAAVFNFRPDSSVIDIGCGGGLPGIPLAIFFPEVQFFLVDSIGKKIKVVEEIIQSLGLKNTIAQHARVESIKNKQFDFAVSRAVASLQSLWKWSKPMIFKRSNNTFKNGLICLKGGDLAAEISESQLRPNVYTIENIFPLPYFKDKFILYQPK